MTIDHTKDPLRGYKFVLHVDKGPTITSGAGLPKVDSNRSFGFQSISGLRMETEVTEYSEGTDAGQVTRKLPGKVSYDNIVLTKGTQETINYFDAWAEAIAGNSDEPSNVLEDRGMRADLHIELRDRSGKGIRAWKVVDAWPTIKEVGTFDATSSDVIPTTYELAHEGLIETKVTS